MASQSRNVDTVGTGTWNNATNATGAHDGNCADTASDGAQQIWIATGFTIPSGATIDGIEIIVHCAGDGDDDVDTEVSDTGGVSDWGDIQSILNQGGTNCAGAADVTKGGSTDLWNTSWAWNVINGNGVYVRLTFMRSGKANSWFVDFINVTVYYTTVTEVTIQKTSDFRVLAENTIQKNADFRVLVENTIQKSADFRVLVESTIQKTSDFRVFGEATIQKTADFRVLIQDITIQKTADFTVVIESTIQKASDFRVLAEVTIQKTADARILGEETIQKTADFRVTDGVGGDNRARDFIEVTASHQGVRT